MKFLVSLLCLSLLVVAAPAQAQGTASAIYYLHAVGACSGAGPELSMDNKDSTGDADGCGAVGAPGIAGDGFKAVYPGKDALGIVLASGNEVSGTIYVRSRVPVQDYTVTMTISADKAACSASVTKAMSPTDYTLFAPTCKLEKSANETVKPQATLVFQKGTEYYMGYEGAHASRVDFKGSPATNATGNATEGPKTKESTPGLASPIIVVALAAVAIIARRRL